MKTRIEIEVPAADARLFGRLAEMLIALDGESRYYGDAERMRMALWEQVTNAEAVMGIERDY